MCFGEEQCFLSAVLAVQGGAGKQRLVRVSISEQLTVSAPQKTASKCAVGGEHGDSLGITDSEGSNAPCVSPPLQQMAEELLFHVFLFHGCANREDPHPCVPRYSTCTQYIACHKGLALPLALTLMSSATLPPRDRRENYEFIIKRKTF